MASPTHLIKSNQLPLLVVVMGVSGTGKSTLGSEIAKHFDILFLDADSLHSDADNFSNSKHKTKAAFSPTQG